MYHQEMYQPQAGGDDRADSKVKDGQDGGWGPELLFTRIFSKISPENILVTSNPQCTVSFDPTIWAQIINFAL